MNKKPLSTDKAPKAIGPYHQAIETNGLLFLSGQIPIDPETNQLIQTDCVEEQTTQVIKNIENLLTARGLTLEHVVKATVFLKNMGDFQKVNAIYAEFFKNNPPARSAVEVARLPKDVLIEIETIATLT